MKQRFALLDLKAAVNELNKKLSNTFIQNFYSTQQRFIFIKFSSKDTLLIEPGVRMHLTQTSDSEISHFCKKLREKCRHAKVQRIYQYGFDRIAIIDIQRFRIVIEFFSAGNIIIIDDADRIVEILRPVPEIGMIRDNTYIFNMVELDMSFDRFKQETDLSLFLPFEKEYLDMFKEVVESRLGEKLEILRDERHRSRVEELFTEIKKSIDEVGGFGEVLLNKGKPSDLFAFKKVNTAIVLDQQSLEKGASIKEVEGKLKELSLGLSNALISLKSKKEVEEAISKIPNAKAIDFGSFNEAAEYYFFDNRKQKKEKEDKEVRIRKAQQKYIEELEIQADLNCETAELLEENKEFTKEILSIFNKVFETKMEWNAFETFWEDEKERGNPHAKAIMSFDLNTKKCIAVIEGNHVELDLTKSLSKNIENCYIKRRKALDKGEKTKVALESIVGKIAKKKVFVPAQKREPYWFEKFHFFFSSENELVIGGKNADQNEIVVKKHMEATDLYFHCNIHGASSIICKGRKEVTILETAFMALCMSKCWDEKVIKDVFYVEPEQVSKTAPSGEYVTKGSFIIKGKKNTVNPYRLEYGVGILFKLLNAENVTDFSKNPGDEEGIIHAMPVAAPWISMKDYKYKVRICPGTEKKTKMCQDIQKMFNEQSTGSREEMLVRSIGENEYMSVVPGKSKMAKMLK
ncbi:hypothetical protein GINT2_000768 [Glugoides intestinalis]